MHEIPLVGGLLMPEHYERSVAGALETTRELRLAAFHGPGLRRLGVDPNQLTASPARAYRATVAWAKAAHAAGLDGAVWMSARLNADRAYLFFGDRVDHSDLRVVTSYGRVFTIGPDRDGLVDLCAVMKVDVLTRTPPDSPRCDDWGEGPRLVLAPPLPPWSAGAVMLAAAAEEPE